MTSTTTLKMVLSPLLRQLRIDSQQLDVSSSYVMDIGDGLTLQLEESPQDHLTLSCLLPMQEADFSSPATLNTLLQCNLLGLAHPPILTATLPEQQRVLLWARQPFSALEAHQLTELFERFAGQAGKLQQFLLLPAEEGQSA